MRRRTINTFQQNGLRGVFLALGLALTASPSIAQSSVVDRAVARLEAQGYVVEEIERTWLGRVRIEAVLNGVEREIVIDPRNGIILRDYLEEDDDDDDDDDGEEDDDDEDDDDEDDDDEEDDDDDD